MGTTYLCGAVVRVHTPPQLGTTDPFVYCLVQEVYVYNDHKDLPNKRGPNPLL